MVFRGLSYPRTMGSYEGDKEDMSKKAPINRSWSTRVWRDANNLTQEDVARLLTVNKRNQAKLYTEYLTYVRGLESGVLSVPELPRHFIDSLRTALNRSAEFWEEQARAEKAGEQ